MKHLTLFHFALILSSTFYAQTASNYIKVAQSKISDLECRMSHHDTQFVEYFSIEIAEGPKNLTAIFENLPIKWNK